MDALIRAFAAVLESLFFLGMIGSLLVVLTTVIRDVGQIIRENKEAE